MPQGHKRATPRLLRTWGFGDSLPTMLRATFSPIWLRILRFGESWHVTEECRSSGAQHPYPAQQATCGSQWPGDEARETGNEQGRSEQGTAGRRGEGILVRVKWGAALFYGRAPHPGDDAPRARSTAYGTLTRPAICGIDFTLRRGLPRTTVPSARRSRGHLP